MTRCWRCWHWTISKSKRTNSFEPLRRHSVRKQLLKSWCERVCKSAPDPNWEVRTMAEISPPPKANGIVVPRIANGWQEFAARLVFVLEHLLVGSLRFSWRDNSGMFAGANAEPVIFCVWHNRLALSMAINRKYLKRLQPKRRLAALVS